MNRPPIPVQLDLEEIGNRMNALQASLKEDVKDGKEGASEQVIFYLGDCRDLLAGMPNGSVQLVVTSPPYNIGKEYESSQTLDQYLETQSQVIEQCVRVMTEEGSLCWQTGNYVHNGEIVPLDTLLFPVFRELGLKMRNRIVWHFEHGLHCTKRLSGRYETISWYTKSNDYLFDVDPIRIPQKYPGKRHFKGPKLGQLSGNPLGKNPGDVWIFPNVKHNHVEKTDHPCQFPVELVERLVLSMTLPDDLVFDPYMGVASTAIGALRHGRRAIGAEVDREYHAIGCERIQAELNGSLRTRPMGKPVYQPPSNNGEQNRL